MAQQLHAVEKAITQAKKTLIHDHLNHCLTDTFGTVPDDIRKDVDAFREIARYL